MFPDKLLGTKPFGVKAKTSYWEHIVLGSRLRTSVVKKHCIESQKWWDGNAMFTRFLKGNLCTDDVRQVVWIICVHLSKNLLDLPVLTTTPRGTRILFNWAEPAEEVNSGVYWPFAISAKLKPDVKRNPTTVHPACDWPACTGHSTCTTEFGRTLAAGTRIKRFSSLTSPGFPSTGTVSLKLTFGA